MQEGRGWWVDLEGGGYYYVEDLVLIRLYIFIDNILGERC